MDPIFETLTLTFEGAIAQLTLNRPEIGNAFDADMHREFPIALAMIEAQQDVRVLLLMAEGKTFSAGGDFSYIRQLRGDVALRERSFEEGMAIFERFSGMRVPVVAAVHGHAIGLGAKLAALSDISVAWKGAKIADKHVQIGLVAGDGKNVGGRTPVPRRRRVPAILWGQRLCDGISNCPCLSRRTYPPHCGWFVRSDARNHQPKNICVN